MRTITSHVRAASVPGYRRHHVQVAGLLEEGRKTGHTFSQPDLIIAATAAHHGLMVVTRDRSDFDRARVPVINPWET